MVCVRFLLIRVARKHCEDDEVYLHHDSIDGLLCSFFLIGLNAAYGMLSQLDLSATKLMAYV